ncbi:MAG: hypothetical protein ACFFEE_04605 [Candidatus Thorarchaeota archaeon]
MAENKFFKNYIIRVYNHLIQSMSDMSPTRIATAEKNYLRGVLRAFLEGKKNSNYVVGCFRNVPISIFDEIAAELSDYAQSLRFGELYKLRKRLIQNLNEREEKTRWSPWVLGKY